MIQIEYALLVWHFKWFVKSSLTGLDLNHSLTWSWLLCPGKGEEHGFLRCNPISEQKLKQPDEIQLPKPSTVSHAEVQIN